MALIVWASYELSWKMVRRNGKQSMTCILSIFLGRLHDSSSRTLQLQVGCDYLFPLNFFFLQQCCSEVDEYESLWKCVKMQ